MSDLIPTTRLPATTSTTGRNSLDRRTTRGLARLEQQTLLRAASVQAEGYVQTEKLREIDSVTREAMTGHAMLCRWRDVLSAGDPILADELRFFSDTARLGKGEVIADLVSGYCREGRR